MTTPPTTEEYVEAVIISGPRKGELIRVRDREQELTVEEEAAFDALIEAAQKTGAGLRAAREEAEAREARQRVNQLADEIRRLRERVTRLEAERDMNRRLGCVCKR